jgi:hypothetical protein
MRRTVAAVVGMLALVTWVGPVAAGMLPITEGSLPDISSAPLLSLTEETPGNPATSYVLSATQSDGHFNLIDAAYNFFTIDDGTYSLTAQVTHAGGLIGGTMSLAGTIDGGPVQGFTAALTDFAFSKDESLGVFDFFAQITSSTLAGYPTHGTVGIRITATDPLPYEWNIPSSVTFSNVSTQADTIRTATEPSSMALMLLGAVTLAAAGRRQAKRRSLI